MIRRLTAVALLALAALVSVAPAARAQSAAGARAAAAAHWLRGELQRLAADRRIAPARVGIAVQAAKGGAPLFQLRGSEIFNIASCTKLVTSATALWALGPEYRFRTELAVARPPKGQHLGEEIPGDLYLVGRGSPALDPHGLWHLVGQLRDRGVRRVAGRLVLDESFFDQDRLPPLYGTRTSDAWYRAPTGALSLSGNAVSVRAVAGVRSGDPARVLLAPRSSYLTLDNRVLTVSRRRSWVKVHTSEGDQQTTVKVRGRVRVGYRGRAFRRRIGDPGLFTGHALLDMLASRGVTVGQRQVVRGRVPARKKRLARHESPPLALVLRTMNKNSDNFVAEQVLKVLGAEVIGVPGTWNKGLTVVQRFLGMLGLPKGTYTMKNGSGLYEASGFTPLQLLTVLRRGWSTFRSGPDFVASLPLAAVDGTLSRRMVGSAGERYVRAKTGTLNNVVTLAGFAGTSRPRKPVAFAVLINDLPDRHVLQARQVADEMAAAIVTYLER